MRIPDEFPKRFITSQDVDSSNRPVWLCIAGARIELVGQGQSAVRKVVLSFRGTLKELALNATNRGYLVDQLGPESDDWIGQRILLSCVDDSYGGKRVRSVRIGQVAVSDPGPRTPPARQSLPVAPADPPAPLHSRVGSNGSRSASRHPADVLPDDEPDDIPF